MKRFGWVCAMFLLLIALLPRAAQAGILTSGQYAYLLEGKDVEVPVDLIAMQGTYLLPQELLKTLSITVAAEGDEVRLVREPVSLRLSLGSDELDVDGNVELLTVPPIRIARRLFVPIETLTYFGIELTVEGKMVLLNDYTRLVGQLPEKTSKPGPDTAFESQTVEGILRESTGAFANIEITFLTPDLLRDSRVEVPWGVRVALLSMVEKRSILRVTITNTSAHTIRLDPKNLFLVGAGGEQAEYLNKEVPITGSVTEFLAPGAFRTAILLYSKVPGPITMFDGNASTLLGQVTGQ